MAIISNNIQEAACILRRNELVAIPTETVYGLAGNGFSEEALLAIFSAKKRPHYNPLILHFANVQMLQTLTQHIPDEAHELIKHFWPGPLTLVLPKSKIVSSLVSANLPNVALRMPNHELTLSLLNQLDFPVAAPSANMFGCVSPTSAQHVQQQLGERIPFILDGGKCSEGLESTIVGFENNRCVIYRLGAITLEELQNVIPRIVEKNTTNNIILAPGMLPHHYAPEAKLFVVENIEDAYAQFKDKNIGVITFSSPFNAIDQNKVKTLSPKRNFKEASRNLYNSLHELDQQKVDIILAERFPDYDLGRTINNRLFKASKKQ